MDKTALRLPAVLGTRSTIRLLVAILGNTCVLPCYFASRMEVYPNVLRDASRGRQVERQQMITTLLDMVASGIWRAGHA